jgi:hypothetical protein
VLAFLTRHIGPQAANLESIDEKLGGGIHAPRTAGSRAR